MVTKQDVERKEIDSLLDLVNIFKEYKTFQISFQNGKGFKKNHIFLHIPRYVLSIRISAENNLYNSSENLIEEIKKLRKEAVMSYLTSQLYREV